MELVFGTLLSPGMADVETEVDSIIPDDAVELIIVLRSSELPGELLELCID